MEKIESSSSRGDSSSPPPATAPATAPTILSPCAACKILRRRCADKCVLAPYFPPTEPAKFTIAHRVFGASNIIKFLQELPESQRADAVSSMVYEASARIRDPVYGCAGAICQLQKQVSELQAELARAQAEVVNMQCQQAHLVSLLVEVTSNSSNSPNQPQSPVDDFITSPVESPDAAAAAAAASRSFLDDHQFDHNSLSGSSLLWEPALWT